MSTDAQLMWDRLPSPAQPHGRAACCCASRAADKPLDLIVLTGGPGAGKTAVLAAARAIYCEHVAVIPEAATILFGGGFPRHDTVPGKAAAQRAIFHVQREAERLVDDEHVAHTGLCDRGTVDGEAYWPGPPEEYWQAVGSSRGEQLARYAAVVHMRTPAIDAEYDHSNVVRVEDLQVARRIDDLILAAWHDHPHRVVVEPQANFEDKLHAALVALRPWIFEPIRPAARDAAEPRRSTTTGTNR